MKHLSFSGAKHNEIHPSDTKEKGKLKKIINQSTHDINTAKANFAMGYTKVKDNTFYCAKCDVTSNSAIQWAAHLQGIV